MLIHILKVAFRVALLLPLYLATKELIPSVEGALLVGFVASPLIGFIADQAATFYSAKIDG